MGTAYSEPACLSAYEGDLRRLHQLLKNDPKSINAQEARGGDTPLIVAYRRGNVRLVQYLLDNNADVSIRNKKRRTVLHYAAKRTFTFLDYLMIIILMPILLIGFFIMEEKQRKNVTLLKLVLSSEVDINAVDYKGNTALHYVCQRKSERLLPLLLDKNPDMEIQNNCGETALDVATRLKFHKIVYMLRKTH